MTLDEAVDAMYGGLKAQWETCTVEIFPTRTAPPELRYEGKEVKINPPVHDYWARASYEAVSRRKASLTTSSHGLYQNTGVIYFDIYCPETEPQAAKNGRLLARRMIETFNGSLSSVWFARPSIRDYSPDRGWYRFGLTAEYRYSERS